MAAITSAVAATAGSAYLSSRASSKAAGAQKDAASQQAAIQQQQYQQSRSDLAPYRKQGENALYGLSSILGLSNPQENRQQQLLGQLNDEGNYSSNLDQKHKLQSRLGLGSVYEPYDWGDLTEEQINNFSDLEGERNLLREIRDNAQNAGDSTDTGAAIQQQLENTPGYQFQLNQGTRAVQNAAAARGQLNSGATLKDLTDYSQGVANQTYQQYVNNLSNLAGMGENAAGQTAQLGQSNANAQSNALAQMGQARASGYLGQAQAVNNGLNNAAGIFGLYKSGYFGS